MIILNEGAPTRYDNNSSSCIDLFLASQTLALSCLWSVVPDRMGSDHCPTLVTLTTGRSNDISFTNSIIPKHVNKDKFLHKFNKIISRSSFNNDALQNYDEFVSVLKESVSCERKKTQSNRIPVPWWNQICSRVVAVRKRASSTFKRNPNPQTYNLMVHAEKTAKHVLREQKSIGWKKYAESLNPDMKISDIWKNIRRFKGRQIVNNIYPSSQNNLLNFIQSYIGEEGPVDNPVRLINPKINVPHFDSSFSMNELSLALKSSRDTSPGSDEIRNSLLKLIPDSGLEIILKCFCQFYSSSIIPESWKQFQVIPILKPSKPPELASSYRPICKISCMRKIFEKILKYRLDYFIESKNILPSSQFGFRKNRSTQDSITILWAHLQSSLSNGSFSITVFLDIKGAFDNVDINILISVLTNLGVSYKFASIIYELFSHKNISIYSSNASQSIYKRILGLPQGSVLSPLLYNIYVNNLENDLNDECFLLQYADDIALTCTDSSIERARCKIQSNLNTLCSNLAKLNLYPSITKTKAIIFSKRQPINIPRLNIGRDYIEYVRDFSFLGVTFQSNLSFNKHITKTVVRSKKLNNILKCIAGVWWGSDPRTILLIYKGMIRPVLDYLSFLYHNSSDTNILKINRIQWSAIRTATGAMVSTHTRSLEVESNMMPLEYRRLVLTDRTLIKWLQFNNHPAIEKLTNIPISRMKIVPLIIVRLHVLSKYKIDKIDINYEYKYTYSSLFYSPSILAFPNCNTNNPNSVSDTFRNIMLSKFSNYTQIFTDGSVSQSGSGCAFLIPEYNIEASFILHKHTSIFMAEAIAIFEALRMIEHLENHKFIVLSDSKSCLTAMKQKLSFKNKILLDIKSTAFDLKNKNKDVIFMWIPSHQGIEGNESVDILAKSSANNEIDYIENENRFSISHSKDLLTLSNKLSITLWQNLWDTSPFGRRFHELKPKVNKDPWYYDTLLKRGEIVCINRLRFGHTQCREHLFKINIVENPRCQCGNNNDSIDHYIFICPLTDSPNRAPFINKMKTKFGLREVNVMYILKNDRRKEIYTELANFLKKSKINI